MIKEKMETIIRCGQQWWHGTIQRLSSYWAAVKELESRYCSKGSLVFTIYAYCGNHSK